MLKNLNETFHLSISILKRKVKIPLKEYTNRLVKEGSLKIVYSSICNKNDISNQWAKMDYKKVVLVII